MFVDQLKNTRPAVLDVVLERSHRRRLVRTRALGKNATKATSKYENFTAKHAHSRRALRNKDETAVRNSRSK
jgi:hypothetical protein